MGKRNIQGTVLAAVLVLGLAGCQLTQTLAANEAGSQAQDAAKVQVSSENAVAAAFPEEAALETAMSGDLLEKMVQENADSGGILEKATEKTTVSGSLLEKISEETTMAGSLMEAPTAENLVSEGLPEVPTEETAAGGNLMEAPAAEPAGGEGLAEGETGEIAAAPVLTARADNTAVAAADPPSPTASDEGEAPAAESVSSEEPIPEAAESDAAPKEDKAPEDTGLYTEGETGEENAVQKPSSAEGNPAGSEGAETSGEKEDTTKPENNVPMTTHTGEEPPADIVEDPADPGTGSEPDLEETKTPVKLAKPVLISAKNVKTGIKVQWEASEGAVTYRVYRKDEGADWKKLCDTKKLSVTDKTTVPGIKYSYSVGCLKVGTTHKASGFDRTGLATCRLEEPVVKLSNSVDGIKVKWERVEGALNYYIFRKNDEGQWNRIAATTKLTYIDKEVTSGVKSRYTVQAVAKNARGKTVKSSYSTSGVSRRFLAVPAPVVTVAADKAAVSWEAVPGATRYLVLRREPGKAWEQLSEVEGLSYTDSGLEAGQTWQYSVRCIKPVYSAYNSKTKAVVILPAPEMENLLYADGVVTVSWKKVDGATGYRVFRKKAGGKWTRVGDTKELTLTDKNTPKGAKVYYRVKAFSEAGMGIPMDTSKNIKLLQWNSKWTYAGNAAIYSGTPVLYQAPAEVRKGIVVCINAGHGTRGGSNVRTLCHPDGSAKVTGGTTASGATTAYAVSTGTDMVDGSSEASNTLKVALITRDVLLEAGYDVLMIREGSDIQLDNVARTVFANKYANCHIAIHYDGTRSDKGAFFMSVPNVSSYRNMEPVKSHWRAHNALGRAVIAGLQEADVKIWGSGEMEMDLTQTSYSTIPSIDLEVGDEASPLNDGIRRKLADGILAGLDRYFGA